MPRNKTEALQRLKIKKAVENLLIALGRDISHPELKETPKRVMRLLYEEVVEKGNLKKLLQVSPYPYKSMVTIGPHRTYSRCPHHLERVELDVWISYIPDGRLLGASKLPRIADYFSKGLNLQEEITDGIAEAIEAAVNPLGVGVYIIGRHMCMRGRGVKSHASEMTTTCFKGLYLKEGSTKEEFLRIVTK